MSRLSAPAVAALALLVVLSGCSVGPWPSTPTEATDAPVDSTGAAGTPTPQPATPSETPTPTAEPDDPNGTVTVERRSLPVNATRIFQRVESMLDADATPPTVVVITSPTPDARDRDEFERRAGLAVPDSVKEEFDGADPVLGTGGAELVQIAFPHGGVDDVPEETIELTLVHEFVHTVQLQRGVDEQMEAAGLPEHVQSALLEGGAVYVEQQYAERYDVRRPDGGEPLAVRERDYESAPVYDRNWRGQYHYAGRYFDRTVDDPAETWAVYEDPPATMEQVVRPNVTEPPRPLVVDVDAPSREVDRRGRYGELFVRTVLETELTEADAATAARGWGNDTLVTASHEKTDGHVWILRWDGEAAAGEFRTALRRYADARTDDTDLTFQAVRAAPEVVALVAGPDDFVAATTVVGTNDTVSVRVDEPAGGSAVQRRVLRAELGLV